jgi:hypothetical protein
MREEYSGLKYSIYRCPSCIQFRKITRRMFGVNTIEDVSPQEAETIARSGDKMKKTAKVAATLLSIAVPPPGKKP